MSHRHFPARQYDLILFDLDGTLADTASDLASALNHTLVSEGRSTLDPARCRPYVSQGSYALIELGFGIKRDDPEMGRLREILLAYYAENICIRSALFSGINQLLTQLEHAGIHWGIVTNKPGYLTTPLLDRLHLTDRASVVVSGDTTPKSKPHPLPLRYACEQTRSDPLKTLYIGDDSRDIMAGQAAGMETMAVRWGYLGPNGDPDEWGATYVVDSPDQLSEWFGLNRIQSCG